MLRDWLIVITILLIAGILLDGYRRMRLARGERIQLSKNAETADDQPMLDTESSSEFPSGGARVAGYRDSKHASSVNKNLKETYLAKKTTVGAPHRIPEQVTLNLDEHVPMLMDSVEAPQKSTDADIDATTPIEENLNTPVEESTDKDNLGQIEPSLGDLDTRDDDQNTSILTDVEEHTTSIKDETTSKTTPEAKPESKPRSKSKSVSSTHEPEADDNYQQPDEVLIINVMAKTGTRFQGEQLLSVLMAENMKLGAMDIFHRHIDDDGEGPVMFSLANMVVPGTFNLAKMKEFETPGVSLFLSLPLNITDEDGNHPDGLCIRAFNTMAETAYALASELEGELKDENRSVMTRQTIEHARQRVVEYERKQKLAKA